MVDKRSDAVSKPDGEHDDKATDRCVPKKAWQRRYQGAVESGRARHAGLPARSHIDLGARHPLPQPPRNLRPTPRGREDRQPALPHRGGP